MSRFLRNQSFANLELLPGLNVSRDLIRRAFQLLRKFSIKYVFFIRKTSTFLFESRQDAQALKDRLFPGKSLTINVISKTKPRNAHIMSRNALYEAGLGTEGSFS
jgi:hypothetical protein